MNKIDLLNYNVNPQPTPSVFNEGFSQYETLSKLIYQINQYIESMNLGADEIAKLIKQAKNLDTEGNFTGLWNGLEMHETDLGLATDWNNAKGLFSTVAKRLDNSEYIQSQKPLKLTTLFDNGRILETKLDLYTAWPFSNLFWDSETKKFGLFLNVKSEHASTGGSLYFVSKSIEDDKFSNPVVIATSGVFSTLCHGGTILHNGDYLALTKICASGNSSITKNNLYRSIDKGVTWTETQLYVDGTAWNEEGTGQLFITETGRIITFSRKEDGPQYHIIYSDDNGATWHKIDVPNSTGYNDSLEPSFVQLSNGTIVMILRASIYTEVNPTPALIMKSLDNGSTWDTLRVSETFYDMSANNCAILHHKETKTVEIFYCSRYQNLVGKGSLYQMIVSEEDLENDNFPTPTIIKYGSANSDFGYPSIAMSDDGFIELLYYKADSQFGGTDIYRMVGQYRSDSMNKIKTNSIDKNGDELIYGTISEIIPTALNDYQSGTLSYVIGQQAIVQPNALRLTSKQVFKLKPNEKYMLINNNTDYKINIRYLDSSLNNISETGWVDDKIITVGATTVFGRIIIKRTDNAPITLSDLKNVKFSFRKYVSVRHALYDNGNEKEFITGTFVDSATMKTGSPLPVLTKNSNNLQVSISNSTTCTGYYISSSAIDMSKYRTLKACVKTSGIVGTCDASLRIYNKAVPTSGGDGRLALIATTLSSATIEIDLSTIDITAPLYVAVGISKPVDAVSSSITAKFFDIWLEQ